MNELEEIKKQNESILRALDYSFDLIAELRLNNKILFGLIVLSLSLIFLLMLNVFKWMH